MKETQDISGENISDSGPEQKNRYFHIGKRSPYFKLHDSISYISDCILGGRSKMELGTRQDVTLQDIKNNSEKVGAQIKQQKNSIAMCFLHKAKDCNGMKFVPPVEFSAFLSSPMDQKEINYSVFEDNQQQNLQFLQNLNEDAERGRRHKGNNNSQYINGLSRIKQLQQMCLKKRFQTPNIGQHINLERSNSQNIQKSNLLPKINSTHRSISANKINQNESSFLEVDPCNINSLHPITTAQPNQNQINVKNPKLTQRIKRSLTEQGQSQYNRQHNDFLESEFAQYMKEIQLKRDKKYIVENSIAKIVNNFKDDSPPLSKKLKGRTVEGKRVLFEDEETQKKTHSRIPTQNMSKLDQLCKKSFSVINVRDLIGKLMNNLEEFNYFNDNLAIPKKIIPHLNIDKPVIQNVILRNGSIRKDLTAEDLMNAIYPSLKKNAQPSENNFDLQTYSDIMEFNSRLFDNLMGENQKMLSKIRARVEEGKKTSKIIRSASELQIKGSQAIDIVLKTDFQNHERMDRRHQMLMEQINLVEKQHGPLQLISTATKQFYNQVSDIINGSISKPLFQ